MFKCFNKRVTQLTSLLMLMLLVALSIDEANARSVSWRGSPPTTDLTIQVNVVGGGSNPSAATFLFSTSVGNGFSLGSGQPHTLAVPHSQVVSVNMASAGWSVSVNCTNGVNNGVLQINDVTPLDVIMAPAVPASCTFNATELPSGAVYPLTGEPATNLCPINAYSVLLYASLYDLPPTPGLTGTPGLTVLDGTIADDGTPICFQHAPKSTWTKATVADFSQYDLLWIGADGCAGNDASDFDAAIKSRAVWEEAIDPNSIMVFGGDIDVHIAQNQAMALDIGADAVQYLSPQQAPGLVLHMGCYASRGAYWLDQLGGIFDGLSATREPLANSTDPNEPNKHHPFIQIFNHLPIANWAFVYACHGGLLVDDSRPAGDLGLLRVVDYHVGSNYDVCVMATKSYW